MEEGLTYKLPVEDERGEDVLTIKVKPKVFTDWRDGGMEKRINVTIDMETTD